MRQAILTFKVLIAVSLLCACAASVAAAQPLGLRAARGKAAGAASSFARHRGLNRSHVAHCKRKTARRIDCTGTAKGGTATVLTTCHLRIRVRAVKGRRRSGTVASVVGHRCKARLPFPAAVSAIQSTADAFAGRPTTIFSIIRKDARTFLAAATWVRPSDPPSESFPTENCTLDLNAVLTNGKVTVGTEGFNCF